MPEAPFGERLLVATEDGSHSLYLPALDEHYHSSHGALQESLHVFIGSGYGAAAGLPRAPLRVLEVGFGTGLNALLTWARSRAGLLPVAYTALEPYKLDEHCVRRLNYPEQLSEAGARVAFETMHRCGWEGWQRIDDHFSLRKRRCRFSDFEPEGDFDLVYHDAFSPAVQPELWTRDVFAKLAGCMSPGAVLVTYCAKGEVRRHMRSVGLTVEKLPGPPGKREMTRARQG
ncbi:tRNA (5-methylaminomethyl-2-thiouridine)(34)-methyltransferase MnmD [Accumulibacter sp.]|uniref:tRNA (5-methylaminomethyl-2-thiouridine)(34)-methyltransferase MnmD n=1 Tax=Accumulibacter sp. TaxID=2053492 RepID=UPI0025EB7C94|nr:tRNA (5-methylaminomethyl-2-thiouridine)(34)-methyltransferase MnmD [Accumulibacter sp.]MCM8610764.1 tRNA (5-methylaminomethyl-2-thiouridine)(34)-methyltransferase MnmD [Accumulibacter sp.]MCM8635342.1 tRNA (5-methylaminomethyl-2-thiouridine)(34)-methyltransferase MnmD [Accumulibacter sp.]MCM8638654.1 tRNA (5-methylaminomethyl-2-thiouridine)(34)-methyltransferase MnmD [Accumulibacter sp.]